MRLPAAIHIGSLLFVLGLVNATTVTLSYISPVPGPTPPPTRPISWGTSWTPIGTAADGSETTYNRALEGTYTYQSLTEFIHYEETFVAGPSGYKASVAATTWASGHAGAGSHGECTVAPGGKNGGCVYQVFGDHTTFTTSYTGVVAPLATITFPDRNGPDGGRSENAGSTSLGRSRLLAVVGVALGMWLLP